MIAGRDSGLAAVLFVRCRGREGGVALVGAQLGTGMTGDGDPYRRNQHAWRDRLCLLVSPQCKPSGILGLAPVCRARPGVPWVS